MVDIDALIRYDYIAFLFALLIVIIGLLYLRQSALHEEDKITLWVIHILVFLFLASIIIMFGMLWVIEKYNYNITHSLHQDASGFMPFFLSSETDQARILIETRTLVGYAEAIIIASISIFLPLLIALWYSFLRELTQTLTSIGAIENSKYIKTEKANKMIENIITTIEEIEKFSKNFRIPFWFSIFFSVILVVIAAVIIFLLTGVTAYLVAIFLGAMSLILFLWYLTMIAIFVSLFLPIERKYKKMYIELFRGE